MQKFAVLLTLILIIGAFIGFIFYINSNTQSFTQLNGTYQLETQDGMVQIGEKGNITTPIVTLSKWNSENFIKLSYPMKDSVNPKVEGTQVTWSGKEQDVYLKKLKANPGATLPNAIDNGTIRYIKYGLTDLSTLAGAYSLPARSQSRIPTISTFITNEDAYVFYGTRPADTDLLNIDTIKTPIVRLRTDNDFACPIIIANKNGIMVSMFYYPNIQERAEEFYDKYIDAMNTSLKKYSTTKKIERKDHLIYFTEGLRRYQLGRIANDKNNMIFYLYINSPYEGDLTKNLRPYIKLTDTVIMPVKDLKDLSPQIDSSFLNSVTDNFVKEIDSTLTENPLSENEKQSLSEIVQEEKNSDWRKYAIENREKEYATIDRFEFDILLKEKPSTNIFTYDIETKDLEFYYQPELTDSEKDSGTVRPQNVIGSYAVYRTGTQSISLYDNNDDAKKYTTGKVFHIYRPKIIDAHGDWIWGKLNVDTVKGKLSVTVDQQWLAAAAYPVIVDPTFGYTTIGGSATSLGGKILGSKFTGVNGTITSITAYVNDSISSNYQYAIYNPTNSALLARTTSGPGVTGFFTWKTQNLVSSLDVTNSQEYVLVAWKDQGSTSKSEIDFDAGASQQGYDATVTYVANSWPNPATFTNTDRKYSIYATYTASGTMKNFKGKMNWQGKINIR